MKRVLRFAFFAGLLGIGCAAASPAGDIAGTWECRQPGVEYRGKPPILYVSENPAGGSATEVNVEVDGFAREVYGRSEINAGQGGWWKVKPARGQEFSIRLESGAKQRTPAMGLRWPEAKNDYRCLRLPLSGAPALPVRRDATPPPEGAPSDPAAAPPTPATDAPAEGTAKKE